jgi:chromosome partitioning protein
MARMDTRVLLIDLDPSGGVGAHLGAGDNTWVGLTDLLMGRAPIDRVVKASNWPTLSLLPLGRLDPADEPEFAACLRDGERLDVVLRRLAQSFDVAFLDVPAGTGPITHGALAVAAMVLPVIKAEPLAERTLHRLLRVIHRVRHHENPDLEMLGFLPTMTDTEDPVSRAVVETLRINHFNMQDLQVPRSNVFAEASRRGQPLVQKAAEPFAEFRVFERLAATLKRRIETRAREESGETERRDMSLVPVSAPSAEQERTYLPFRTKVVEQHGRPPEPAFAGLAESGTSFGWPEWKEFLDSCLLVSQADTAFVVDREGLAILSRGKLTAAQVEGAGTRLLIAADQAQRMDLATGSMQTVLIEFDDRWLTGLSVPVTEEHSFLIGILARDPVTAEIRDEIRTLLTRSLGHLDGVQGTAAV